MRQVDIMRLEQRCNLENQEENQDKEGENQEEKEVEKEEKATQRRLARQMMYMYHLLKQGCAIKLNEKDEIEIVHNWDDFPRDSLIS